MLFACACAGPAVLVAAVAAFAAGVIAGAAVIWRQLS
jgi:hypothetical protein